ncbi:MAG: hypothetical protein QOI24_1848 [Acidobacteriota bacterium]|jgi:uncharacterized repeat protein (TIGR01451 family)|nr:hypothetical protein [Acidobacteriota bacterium]
MKSWPFRTPEERRCPSDVSQAPGSATVNFRRAGLAFFTTIATLIAFGVLLGPQAMSTGGGTFTVTNVADNTSGNTTAGSLRDGITAANNGGCAAPCTIVFGVTGNINLFSPLPTITVAAAGLTVDGFSATGAVKNTAAFGSAINATLPVAVTSSSGAATAFDVAGSNVTIQGLVISGFNTRAVRLANVSGTVKGCFIGTNSSGTAAQSPPGATGIEVSGGTGNAIGGTLPEDRNLISGNTANGIWLSGSSATILGNYIGTNAAGTSVITSQPVGIRDDSGGSDIGNATMGNVISGHGTNGILLATGTGTVIRNNRIGTNAAGTGNLGNSVGIFLGGAGSPSGVSIGGTASQGNLIGGNATAGIEISSAGTANTISENNIGVNLSGTLAISNNIGIKIAGGSTSLTINNNRICGSAAPGVFIAAGTNTTITANDIGVYGSTAIGNGGRGVYVTGGTGTSITNNKVVNNVGNGVDIDGPTGVKITGNSIGSNSLIGIDLHASALNSGATPNDGGDVDSGGGNNYQNFPNITSAVLNGSTGTATLTAKFLIDSVNIVASQSFKVELFEADTSTTPQGLRLLGSQCYAGNSGATLSMSVPTAGLSVGSKIVGTATSYTDSGCSTVGDGTSEFSTAAITTLQPGLVVNTSDSGSGSLRQAILDANGGTCASPCTITFNIPTSDANYSAGSGTFAIKPLSALSVLAASNAFIDGKTQTTFTGNTNASGPEIVIDGALAGATSGLQIGYSVGGSGANISIRSLVVNHFQGYGIVVAGNGPNNVTNATVVDCYVGTDGTGTIAQANGLGGIDIQEATGTQIGLGTNLGGGQPNVISGNNGNGITILNSTTSSTKVAGNIIGLDAFSTPSLPNNGAGIYIGGGAINSTIGGGSAAFGNTIAFNTGAGIAVVGTSAQNGIRRNSIYSNGGLGIDLNNDGITGNDTGDGDTGPNGLQNAPVLTTASYSCGGNTTVINGTLNSAPGTAFEIDWFTSPTVDPSGHGEGKTYQGTSNFTTDALGDAAISIALTGDFRASNVTATATKQASTETSEFSALPTAANSAPVATTDAIVTNEDTAGSTNVLSNDSDNECDTLSIAGFTQGANGAVNCFSTTCTYTPNLNTNGSDTFTYTVSDGTQTTVGTVNVTVNSVNDPPVATNDTVAAFEDTTAAFNILTNDSDVDGPSALTVSGTTAPTSGSVTCSPSGNCTYTPATNANGSATFNYTVTDGTNSTTGAVTINITAVNDPPSFNSGGNVTVSEDSAPYSASWATAISAGPPDESGQSLTFNVTNTNGPLFSVQPSIASNGVLSFTLAANANGTSSVNVTLLDNGGVANGGNNTSLSQTFTITVNAVNDGPTAVNDALTTAEDTPSTVNVLTNDTDPENDTLTVVSNTNGTLGNASCSPTGGCTYTPNLNASGVDSFTYTITDGLLTSTGTVNVTINASNDPPVANNDSYSVAGNSTLTVPAPGVLGNDTDVDSAPPFTATLVSGPAHGSATLNPDGSLSYTPTLNYTGPDSIIYNAKDSGGAISNNATININVVTPINAADLALAITDSPDPVAAGAAVNYIATVSNSGPNTNSAYSVNFAVTGGTITGTSGAATCSGGTTSVSCTGTAIAAGNSASISLVVNAGAGATVTLTGSISYAVDPNTSNNTASQTTTITPSADLIIAKTLTGSLSAGQNATYTISVQNNGPSDATGVTVSDTPGAGLTFVSNSGACSGTFPCNVGTLTVGQIVTINSTFAVSSSATGSLTNSASVSSSATDPQPTSNTASSTAAVGVTADVSIAKSGPATAQPNTNISYAITVFNSGPGDATGVVVTDPLPARLTFVSATGACTSFPCSIGSIPAGTNKFITATYNVTPGPNTTVTNVATVNTTSTDPDSTNNSASKSTNVGCHTTPNGLLPSADQTNVATNGTLHWNNAGATSYNVYLGPVGSGCTTLLGNTTATSMSYSGLTGGTTYEWRVEAVSTGCPSAASACQKFTTATVCPGTGPTLIAPLAGSLQSSPLVFSWTAVPNAALYHVFAAVGGASTLEIGSTSGTTLTANVGDGATVWFVIADVVGCGTLQSVSGTFNVCNNASPVAGVVAEASSGQSYDVAWEAVAGATKYEIDEATNAAFTNVQMQTVTTTSVTYTHTAATSAQPFFYRVRAFSSCRQQFGSYSETIRIVIAPIPAGNNPNHNANVPAGSKRIVVQQVFVPGFPDGSFPFTATVDKPWLTVTPSSGILPPQGITLNVTADPANLPNGTFTGTVLVNIITPNNSGGIASRANRALNIPVSVSLVTPVLPQPKTEPYAASLIIPSVGHLDGIASRWQSDIRVANTSTAKAHYQLVFTPQGDDASKGVKQTTIEIDANGTTALDDIVRNWYGVGSLGETANGVLEIRPLDTPTNFVTGNATSSFTQSTVASSRTYNTTSTGTLGQFIPAVPFANFIGRAPSSNQLAQVLSLQQIAQSDAYRTNIGVVEASGKPASVMLSVFATSGAKLLDYPLDLRGGEQVQLNGFLAEHGISLSDGRVEVKVVGGDGKVTAYASVVDNHTNDPLLVSGTPLNGAQADRYVLPGVADLNTGFASWRTDARIFNASTTPQAATLTFYPQNNSGSPVANAITINPGEVRTLDNILQSFFALTTNGGSSNLGGALHISTPGASNLVVTGRTYNKTSEGTFGQYIPAVTVAEAVGSNDRALNILQVEESPRYRTNLGLAEVSGKEAHVEITVNLPDSKVSPRIEFTMAPNEFRQFGIINELGLPNTYNARITVKVLDGDGRVTAYGSVIDRETQDPTYVPAQ